MSLPSVERLKELRELLAAKWATAEAFDGPLDTPCMFLPHAYTKEYPTLSLDGRTVRASRAFYEFLIGPIPPGHDIDHLCRERACINAWHFEPVPRAVNTYRGIGPSAANKRKTHCPRGHELSGENLILGTKRGKPNRKCRVCTRKNEREAYARRGGWAHRLTALDAAEEKEARADE